MSDIAVRVRDVSQLYSSASGQIHWALSNVSLDIAAGEFVCAIGPSGCGKTTLLNMIAGFLEPTLGSVEVDGHGIKGPGPDRGVVFQEYALFPWLSARRNVEFGLKQQGLNDATRSHKAEDLLALTGLTHAANRFPFELG